MKQIIYILVFLLASSICYHFFFPNVIIDIREQFIKGDTITTVINQKQFDSLTYHFKAEIEIIKKQKSFIVSGNPTR